MKKLIITTVALAAFTFGACKKDNLQPTTNTSSNIEQLNGQVLESEQEIEEGDIDDKAVDPRTKFVGTWKLASYKVSGGEGDPNAWSVLNPNTPDNFIKIKITKQGTKQLKITVIKQNTFHDATAGNYSKVNSSITKYRLKTFSNDVNGLIANDGQPLKSTTTDDLSIKNGKLVIDKIVKYSPNSFFGDAHVIMTLKK